LELILPQKMAMCLRGVLVRSFCVLLSESNGAALIGGAGCGGREASHATRDNRSSALFGAHMPLSFIFFIFFYLFPCTAPITGALNSRAAPLRSAGTVFCFLFPPNEKITRSVAIGCIALMLGNLFNAFF
jgi:hypothetical protein